MSWRSQVRHEAAWNTSHITWPLGRAICGSHKLSAPPWCPARRAWCNSHFNTGTRGQSNNAGAPNRQTTQRISSAAGNLTIISTAEVRLSIIRWQWLCTVKCEKVWIKTTIPNSPPVTVRKRYCIRDSNRVLPEQKPAMIHFKEPARFKAET
jgi:hypothetical protein